MLVLSCFPRLVVTTTTPLAPRIPKIAAEAASFNTLTDSISLGSIRAKSAEERSTPSMINAGDVSPRKVAIPRIYKEASSAPGSPLACFEISPGICPTNVLVELADLAFSNSSLFIEATAPVRLAFF